jgi:hypothetical protein
MVILSDQTDFFEERPEIFYGYFVQSLIAKEYIQKRAYAQEPASPLISDTGRIDVWTE